MVDIFEVLKGSAVAKFSLSKMPSSANEQETPQGICKSLMKPVGDHGNEVEAEEEEDEEEDVDFNPFLKETPSPEASSSLSSEIVGDSEHGEEEITTKAATASPEKACEEENNCQKEVVRKTKKRTSALISQSEVETFREKENGSASSGVDVNDCMGGGSLSNTTHLQKPAMDFDDEDAICRRTRARYSLASFTLDELEAFLQETDDDDDLQNVDDEEEYRKFLAAVLLGGDGDGQSTQENENVDDEDEDNDADFEIELEEMLESDCDEGPADKTHKEDFVRARRRPETRQNKRQKASAQYKKKLLEQTKRPLRPLLPILPNGPPISPFPILDGKTFMPETAQSCPSSTVEYGLTNGFTSYQIGQLYCLIHEHVQLLVQVFSLCILDPTRQQIASQVQGLIFEMLHKRDEALAFRIEPYPDICFHPPHTCSSVSDALPQVCFEQRNIESSSSFEVLGVSSSPNTQMPALQNISSDKACFWLPSISDPVRSVLDVAPLNLVGKYVDDVYTAVQDYRQRCLTSGSNISFEKAPLFPFPSLASVTETNGKVPKGRIHPAENTVTSATSQQPSKKSLAAALVESTKKQSVALVPKEISKLAQRFLPLFNPSLFPHKPPPVAVANRVLFTEAEDELLALGMMEYNTDWKAVQQRFLPCKTKHQIFVRQKNRCSSKAPENPIKAVRRLKTSPLTPKEIECIQEGLKFFKLDWMSVWKFVVPHRDPTLLQRQWRIALGTQKSYKQDAAKKEKRRLYELKRKCKTADLANWHLDSDTEGENAGGDNNGRDDYLENADEGFVHEAFLADWRPGVSNYVSSGHPCLNLGEEQLHTGAVSSEVAHIVERPNNYGSGEAQPPSTNMHKFPFASNYSQNPLPSSQFTHVRHRVSNGTQQNHPVPNMVLRTSHSQVCLPPYRARRSNNTNLVKLAPDLPPVNLPPSVRIISQSASKTVHGGSSNKISASAGSVGHSGQENAVPLNPNFSKFRNLHLIKTRRDKMYPMKEKVTNSHLEESHVEDRSAEEERGTESDLQMHPLLFQAPEDGRLPYYPLNCTTGISSSFSFFSGNQPQLNLSLFHSPRQVSHIVNSFNKSLKTKESTSGLGVIDFHPLLKRADDATNASVTASSMACLSVGLEKSDQCKNPFDADHNKSSVNCGTHATGSVPSSSNEKANELDLEIHLSSSSTKERALGSRDMAALNPMQSLIIVADSGDKIADSGDKLGTQNPSAMYYPYGEKCGQIVSSTSNIDDIGDHSHPGIVMEQEELSDSDEEVEEHVEFECEEMTDSEGEEGSGCEQIAEMPEKEVLSVLTEKATDGNSDHQQHEASSPPHGPGSVSAPRKGSSHFLKLGLTNLGKDTKNGSWLSLNSCDPGHPTCTKSKNKEGTMIENVGTKKITCRPSRSCKKTTPSTKKIAAQTHSTNVEQQLSPSPLAVQGVRKLRKRGCCANTGTNTGRTDDKDGVG